MLSLDLWEMIAGAEGISATCLTAMHCDAAPCRINATFCAQNRTSQCTRLDVVILMIDNAGSLRFPLNFSFKITYDFRRKI